MNTFYLAIAAALTGGAVLPLQSLINARLAAYLHGPLWAGATSALLSAIVLVVAGPLLAGAPSLASAFVRAPVWVWFGGLLGAVYMVTVVLSVKVLGATGLVATTVLGQLVGAMLLDTFGVLNPAVPLSIQRVAGCLLAIGGVWLVTQKP